MAKHCVKVQHASAKSGNGLFAAELLPCGSLIPAKGPWHTSRDALLQFLKGQGPVDAASMSRRVVETTLTSSTIGQNSQTAYKTLTGVVGFVNHWQGIARKANAKFTWNEARGLGEYCLMLELVEDVQAGKEIVIDYGPKHSLTKAKGRPIAKRLKKHPAVG
jgi:hypothetical protein